MKTKLQLVRNGTGKARWRLRSAATVLSVLAGLAAFRQTGSAQTPLALTGFNIDLIAETNAASPSVAVSGDFQYGFAWFQEGATNTPAGRGLPANGLLTSMYGAGATFQLAPYSQSNVLKLQGGLSDVFANAGQSGTLTLTTPTNVYALQFLVEGANSPIGWTATLNFSDSSSSTLNALNNDWTSGSGNIAAVVDLVSSGATTWADAYPAGVFLYEDDFVLSAADAGKKLTSITFQNVAWSCCYGPGNLGPTPNTLGVFAVSAQTIPTPPPVPPTTNAVIIADHFSGNDGGPIGGRTPDTVDVPGVTYTTNQFGTYACCANVDNSITTSVGNPSPSVAYGFDNYSGVSIASVSQVYGKPSHFHISADVMEAGIGGNDTVRGMTVGFTPAGGPNNWIGHQGANNLSTLWLCPPSAAYTGTTNPVIVLQSYGESYLNWVLGSYTNHIIGVYDDTILGAYSGNQFYTLAYDVDTVAGSISNITISTLTATQHIAGTFGNTFSDANTMYAFVGSSGTGTGDRPFVDNFAVVGLPNVPHAPPSQPTPSNIVFDDFIGTDSYLIGGRAPDFVNLPGGTWTGWAYFGQNPYPEISASSGNPSTGVEVPASGQMYIPIASAGSYTKPSKFMISADLMTGSIAAGDVVRGIMLGFCTGTPTNHYGFAQPPKGEAFYAGHEGADNFCGVWLDPAHGDLYMQTNGNSYLGKPGDSQAGSPGWEDVVNINPIVTNTTFTFSPSQFYHLSYWVDTTSGTISGITLSDGQNTQIDSGVYGDGMFTAANTAYAALQSASGSGTGNGFVDNFGVNAPQFFEITSITRVGNDIVLVWKTTGGTVNEVQASPSLNPSSFAGISGNITISGSGSVTHSYTIVGGATNTERFYRIRLVP